ncbi:MAG: hypothetical protein GY769_20350, partial [bacterium]|nr:hypothetical protein [bacterium]
REVLMRVGQLAHCHPRVVELDINPFVASPDRDGAVALDVRIRVEREAARRRNES